MKRTLTIAKLGGPLQAAPIELFISDDTIGVRVDLEAFLTGVVAEMGNPTFMMTNAQLAARLRAAVDRVILAAKEETRFA